MVLMACNVDFAKLDQCPDWSLIIIFVNNSCAIILNNDYHYLPWPILVVVIPVSVRADMRVVLLCVGLATFVAGDIRYD